MFGRLILKKNITKNKSNKADLVKQVLYALKKLAVAVCDRVKNYSVFSS